MIKFDSRYDAYAYRVGWFDIDDSVAEIEEGQYVKLNDKKKIVLAGDGDSVAWMAIGSKRKGRNQVAGKCVNKIAFLHGAYCVSTNQVTGTIQPMDPMKVGADGKLVKATLPADASKVVAWCLFQDTTTGMTKILSA